MKRGTSSRRNTERSTGQGVLAQLPMRQIGIILGVLILIGAVLLLKARQSPASSAELLPADSTTQIESVRPTLSDTPGAVPPMTPIPEATNTFAPSSTPAMLPERQLNRLLEAGEPVLLFFHSNSCAKCIQMTQIVEEVHPDFSDSVALVDVDVYDERNKSLLQRARIQAIPTLVFIDREGEVGGHVGVMEPDALREQLRKMGEE